MPLQGTIMHATDFDPDAAAEQLNKAVVGLGTDEETIIRVLTSCNNQQRQEIKASYEKIYSKELESDLKDDTSGDFCKAIMALLTHPTLYDARELHRALTAMITDDETILEILLTRTNSAIEAIKKTYQAEYGKELTSDLQGETGGVFRFFLLKLAEARRDKTVCGNIDKAKADAKKLYKAGEGKIGTDELTFDRILVYSSYSQLSVTFQEYNNLYGHPLEEALEKETRGDLKKGYLAILKVAKSLAEYMAESINESVKGVGTNDTNLIRQIISRSEIDLADIKWLYHSKYGVTLVDDVIGDTSGDYRRLLVSVLGS